MQVDNVSSPGVPGFAELGISPHSVENMLEQTSRSRQGGLPDGSAARTSWKPKLVFIVTRRALCVPTIDTPESSFRKRQCGCLDHAATLRCPSPLIKPSVPISGTREIQLNCSLAVLEWRVK